MSRSSCWWSHSARRLYSSRSAVIRASCCSKAAICAAEIGSGLDGNDDIGEGNSHPTTGCKLTLESMKRGKAPDTLGSPGIQTP
ncbi:hypothetical protein WMF18_33500 [Sorangium sp. So ce315]|uniref:hypothetical protein n=1 Tax=Sorangium sp. So ce315 TaxID=3133299 RepID=UPI003F60ECBB